MNRLLFSIFIVLTFHCYTIAQEQWNYHHSPQILGLPMQYIPSFAGNIGRVRLATDNYLFNGNTIENASAISVDGFIPRMFTGIGFYMTNYNSDQRKTITTYDHSIMGLVIAPKISVKGKYTLSPGIAIETRYAYLRTNYDTKTDSYYTDQGKPINSITDYHLQQKISFLFNTKKFYMGTAFYSRINDFADLRLSLQMGATFQRTDESKLSFSPAIVWEALYQRFRPVYEYDSSIHLGRKQISLWPNTINLNFRYQKVLFGLANGFMVGFQNRNFRIMYTTNPDFAAHSLTMRLLFNNKESKQTNTW